MPIVKSSARQAAKKHKTFNWTRHDALSDKAIARQIANHRDAVPDMTTALQRGEFSSPIKPEQIKAVRRKTGLSQSHFAARLQLNVATIRNWEQGRTHPDGAAVTLLTIINREPKLVMRALEDQRVH
jgi:putative transcriptional regulator